MFSSAIDHDILKQDFLNSLEVNKSVTKSKLEQELKSQI